MARLFGYGYVQPPETREYIARMVLTRLTGTRDAWLRLNGPFATAIRRRFLYWRAVSPDQKAELFASARTSLQHIHNDS